MKQLSLSARPRTLDELVGQEKLVKRIRRGIKKSGVPKGWMFWGQKGSGKTSIARILALSLQCTHQEKFGNPCINCRLKKANFSIYQLNCARNRGVEDMEKFVAQADYEIVGKGARKVFILDEVQELSRKAQRILLDQTEEMTNNAVWILTTTEPHAINSALRSRLKVRALKPFDRDDTLTLVTKLLERLKCKLDPELLTDSLVESAVTSARQIAHAVEAFAEGDSPEDAADVDSSTDVSSKQLCRAVVKGDWNGTSVLMRKASPTDVRPLKSAVIGYLRVVLLDSSEINSRTDAVAKAIKALSYVGSAEEANQMGVLVAELHDLCKLFGEYSL